MNKRLAIVLLSLLTVGTLSAQPWGFTQAVSVSSHVGCLTWKSLHGEATYRLYRLFADEEDYRCIATLGDTTFCDTLRRTICGDTVTYRVEGVVGDSTYRSSPVGIFYEDNVPTAPCSLRLCSVDTLLRRIRLSWYPSPDTDVMGYYICMGVPCRDYDTVWGRMNTSYLCPDELDCSDNPMFSFRVLAFDSCFQASPLTPYFHNPRLHIDAEPCSREIHYRWERYINMPDSVGRYSLHYRLDGDEEWHVHRVGGDEALAFDTVVGDLDVASLQAFLSVDNIPDSLHALSLCCQFHFDYGDTAEYLAITHLDYNEAIPSVTLTMVVDPNFAGDICHLYRASGESGDYERIATLSRSESQTEGTLTYTDYDINRSAGRYCYRIGAPDLCQQWEKYSDTVQLLLPEVAQPEAWFPNTLQYGDPLLGRFCPHFVSLLADGYSLDVFNRYGAPLFHTADPSHCWDGTDLAGRPLPQGVYVYRAHCRHADGTDKTYTGTVLLLK